MKNSTKINYSKWREYLMKMGSTTMHFLLRNKYIKGSKNNNSNQIFRYKQIETYYNKNLIYFGRWDDTATWNSKKNKLYIFINNP